MQNPNCESVLQYVRAFVSLFPFAEFGPGHIALSDYNLLDDNLDFCLNLLRRLLEGSPTKEEQETYAEHTQEEMYATLSFLETLQFIPEEWRDVHAESDEDE